MVPQLTTGALQRILNGENISNVVIQILGCKKIPGTGNDRFRLLISDGVTGCPFGMLGTQLNYMVSNKELEKFTIVRLDKYVCNAVQSDRKVIILLSLTVLAPGLEVKEKIGNPVNSNASSTATSSIAAASNDNASASKTNSYQEKSIRQSFVQPVPNGDQPHCYPLSSLTPYQNKWTIKVRVTVKSSIRTYSNSRGEGKYFSMNLCDESGEIKATVFNDAVDKFFDMLEMNKVYYISKATLKTANAKFSSVKNEYEMTFNSDTCVAPCEEVSSIPMVQNFFNFIPIADIEKVEKNTCVDVIGICKTASDVQTSVSRATNKEFVRRNIMLLDRSNAQISLTLWGNEAQNFDGSMNPVVVGKGIRVTDFNGCTLSALSSSTILINPDIKEAHILKGWYDREGCNAEFSTLGGASAAGAGNMGGQWKSFGQAAGEQLGMGGKPDYYMNKATVAMVKKENCMYMACPSEDCYKKVVDMNNGLYRCEKCNQEYTNYKWRLILSVSLADYSDSMWITSFQEPAEALIGIKADELGSLKESDEEKFNEVLADANFKSYIFKLRTSMETFNEESRLKTTVISANPVDSASFCKKLLQDIKNLKSLL